MRARGAAASDGRAAPIARTASGGRERRIQAALLDAAGTLIEIDPPAPRLRLLLAERCGVQVSLDEASVAIVAEIAFYRSHMHEGSTARGLDALRLRCAEELRAALPQSAALAAVGAPVLRELLLDALVFRAHDDAARTLRTLREAGLRLVVASNWDCSLPGVLERAGLLELVDGVACSAVVGAAKPDPKLIEAALAIAGVEPQGAIHVGDSLTEDVAAAIAAGVAPVYLSRGSDAALTPRPGVTVIQSLAELPRLLGL